MVERSRVLRACAISLKDASLKRSNGMHLLQLFHKKPPCTALFQFHEHGEQARMFFPVAPPARNEGAIWAAASRPSTLPLRVMCTDIWLTSLG
jgi:hypothetical protein